jgi:hypothetical protein
LLAVSRSGATTTWWSWGTPLALWQRAAFYACSQGVFGLRWAGSLTVSAPIPLLLSRLARFQHGLLR